MKMVLETRLCWGKGGEGRVSSRLVVTSQILLTAVWTSADERLHDNVDQLIAVWTSAEQFHDNVVQLITVWTWAERRRDNVDQLITVRTWLSDIIQQRWSSDPLKLVYRLALDQLIT